MTGALPKAYIHNLRRFDLLVVVSVLLLTHVAFDGLINGPTSRMPKHHARRFFLSVKQVEFFGDLSVIPLLGFGDAIEIGF